MLTKVCLKYKIIEIIYVFKEIFSFNCIYQKIHLQIAFSILKRITNYSKNLL